MKVQGSIMLFLICLVLCGCITEYEPTGIAEVEGILVVDGIITDDETYVTLTRSVKLNEPGKGNASSNFVDNAGVYVECDDGTQIAGEYQADGQYLIKTGKLNLERQYRLKIVIEELDNSKTPPPPETYEYHSDFLYPIATSGIDSVFWMKKNVGEPVTIHVATKVSEDYDDNIVLYYLWSYQEDWEIKPFLPHWGYPSVCWNKVNSSDLLLGSAANTVSGSTIENITEIEPSNRKLSEMYRITVKQNAISKRAYEYFSNIKKNSQQTGSIFSPIPLELAGNITFATNPDIPVIGYVEVSTTTQKHRYISRGDNVYEPPYWTCQPLPAAEIGELNEFLIPPTPPGWTLYQAAFPGMPALYVKNECVECDGAAQKPDDWPN